MSLRSAAKSISRFSKLAKPNIKNRNRCDWPIIVMVMILAHSNNNNYDCSDYLSVVVLPVTPKSSETAMKSHIIKKVNDLIFLNYYQIGGNQVGFNVICL